VKTAAQAARLAEMGSDVGQGDFFAPVGRPEDIEAVISARTTR
jgi:EAL domain-containing protein (putative c-di-GMP-specific phosphodiesterase class I)